LIDKNNRFLFLEINPAGEFDWLDELFDNQISKAIANRLTKA